MTAGALPQGTEATFVERALTFDCCGERLVGIVAEPLVAARAGVVVVVGGPQYRVGSHRQFTLLARCLAGAGIAVLRFDYRGMGDATGAVRSFDDVDPDIAAAIGALQAACPAVERVALWGLCDAASAALIYWQTTLDPRVAAMALLNPWVRSDATIAKTHLKHYYRHRFLQRDFWTKLARGRVDVIGGAKSVFRSLLTASAPRNKGDASAAVTFQDRMAEGMRSFGGAVLILLSGRDLTANEFVEYVQSDPRWQSLLERPNVERQDIGDADHTFSKASWRNEAETRTLDWLRRTLLDR